MKPSTRWVVGLVSVWVAVLAVVAAAQQPAGSTPAGEAQAQGQKSPQQIMFERLQRGERVMNLSCSVSGCHTTRPIQTSAMDQEGWSKTIHSMVEKGAKIAPEDIEILTEYLVRFHGPLPDGDGKAVLLNICTICHDLQRVRTRRDTIEGWKELLDNMIFEGAPLADDQIPVLLTYLARNFHQ